MDLLFANNAESTLSADITAIATSFTIPTADASKFPAPTGGRIVKCTLVSKNTLAVEIVHITARAANVFTIARGQEATVAKAFKAGDLVTVRWTKECSDMAANKSFAYTPALYGTTAVAKVVTEVAIAGGIATCKSVAHGYANGDRLIHLTGWPNENLTGVFTAANVTADTYDITFRTDRSNVVPVSATGLAAGVVKSGAYAIAVGQYRVQYDLCFFEAWLTATGLVNITGDIYFVPPVPPTTLPGAGILLSGAIVINTYQNINHTGELRAILPQSGGFIALQKNFGGGLSPATLVAGDLLAGAVLGISGSYFVTPQPY